MADKPVTILTVDQSAGIVGPVVPRPTAGFAKCGL